MVYEAKLYRPREVWLDFELTCEGIKVTYRAGFESGLAILCQALRNAGHADGPIRITERTKGGLRQELPSIFRVSEMPVLYGRLPPRDEIEEQEDMRARGVAPQDATPTIERRSTGLSPAMRATIERLLVDEGVWATTGGRMKGMLAAAGYVEVVDKSHARVTEPGRAAFEAAPVAEDASEASPEPIPATPMVAAAALIQPTHNLAQGVTVKQREAFEVILRAPDNWRNLHGKTRNFMVSSGWVQVSRDEMPTLTTEGEKVVSALGMSA